LLNLPAYYRPLEFFFGERGVTTVRSKEMYPISFAFRVSLCSLALSLSLVRPALALFQAPASTPSPHQSSDEEAVRALAEKYGLAIAAWEIETMRPLWNPQSPSLASGLRVYQRLFSNTQTGPKR